MLKVPCFIFFLVSLCYSDTYHLSKGAVDGVGSEDQPWGTFAQSIPNLQPGDQLIVHSGEYYESVDLSSLSGLDGVPISISAKEGDRVRLSGVEELDLDWSFHQNGIYKAKLNKVIWQLFKQQGADRSPLTLARFPNAAIWSDESFNTDTHWRVEGAGSTNGLLIDKTPVLSNTPSLASQGVSFEGAVAVMNLRNWHSYAKVIDSHTAGSNEFSYSASTHYTDSKAPYFIEGMAALDTIGEWFFDVSDSTLYYYPSDETELTNKFYGRTLDRFFKGGASTKNLIIEGFEFFASNVGFSKSENLVLRNNHFIYAASSKRTLGETGGLSSIDFGESVNALISQNTFEYFDGYGLFLTGSTTPEVRDNSWYMIDHASLGVGYTIHAKNVKNLYFHHNEIKMAGSSEGLRVAPTISGGARVEFNHFERMGLTQTDGAAIQCTPMNLQHSIFAYNWFLHNDRTGLRFDGNPGGTYGIAYRNVSYKSMRGFRIKGDYHQVYNNTSLSSTKKNDIVISIDKGGCLECITKNNAAEKFSGADRRSSELAPIPGDQSFNYIGWEHLSENIIDHLVDPQNYNFRLREGSKLIDAGIFIDTIEVVTKNYKGLAPDQGAYEYGGEYWIPGPRSTKIVDGLPKNKSGYIPNDPSLFWKEALGAKEYHLYIDTSYIEVVLSGVNDESYIGVVNNREWSLNELDSNSIYYWRVDVLDTNGVWQKGDVSSFTVMSPSRTPDNLPSPDELILQSSPYKQKSNSLIGTFKDGIIQGVAEYDFELSLLSIDGQVHYRQNVLEGETWEINTQFYLGHVFYLSRRALNNLSEIEYQRFPKL